MTTLFLRTVLIYLFLMVAMRLMGKRQIGELEIADLATTILVSEIASLPIIDPSKPLLHAIIPIGALIALEFTTSALVAAFPQIKNLFTTRPAVLIRDGRLCGDAMKKSRISADELISELRQKDISDPAEVRYAILEQNGRISVLTYAAERPPTAKDLKLHPDDKGLFHIIIDKGTVNRYGLSELHIDRKRLSHELASRGLTVKDVYLMLISDSGEQRIIRKSDV